MDGRDHNIISGESGWIYMNIELVVDDCDESISTSETLEIDRISWKFIIEKSLSNMYGIIGTAYHFDILGIVNNQNTNILLIRIQPEDKEAFRNSIMAYTFKLSDIIGGSLSVTCSIRCRVSGEFLGNVIDSSFFLKA